MVTGREERSKLPRAVLCAIRDKGSDAPYQVNYIISGVERRVFVREYQSHC